MTPRRKRTDTAAAAAVPPPPRIPTVEEFAYMETRAKIPCQVEWLFWPDGAPVQFILQVPSYEQEMLANHAAIREGQAKKIGYCDYTWGMEMTLAAIAEPKIDPSQKRVLLNANPYLIEQILEAIDEARTRTPRAIEARLEQLAGVSVAPTPGTEAAD